MCSAGIGVPRPKGEVKVIDITLERSQPLKESADFTMQCFHEVRL